MKTQTTVFALVTAILLVACMRQLDVHQLELHMPESKVVELLGPPDKFSILQCNNPDKTTWTCKVFEYTEIYYGTTQLRVWFYESWGEWYINSFQSF